MPLNSGILQQIAQGGQSLVPEMMRKGAQLGQSLKLAQQADQDRSALQEIANAFGTGGRDAALQAASRLGQLTPAMQLQQAQDRQTQLAESQAFRQQQFGAQQAQRDEDQAFRQQQAGATQDFRGQQLGLQRDALSQRRAEAIAKRDAKIAEAGAPGGKFKDEHQLQKTFQGVTKDFREVRDAFSRVKAAGSDPSAAGDLALVFNFMKILDPGSVVRESEFETAAASGSLGERFKAAGQRLQAGERLSPTMRADFINQANTLFEARNGQFNKTAQQFKSLAERQGFNPDNVVLDFSRASEPEQPIGTTGQTPGGLNFRIPSP